jgi:spermidine synthase
VGGGGGPVYWGAVATKGCASPETRETEGRPAGPRALAPLAWAVLPLLFASGLCSLVYQIAWQRELRLVFGASTAASAAVVAVFMGGIGLGAWVIGPRADRRRHPLMLYAALELAVAVTAALTPPLLGLVREAYLALGGTGALGEAGGAAVRLLLAGLVLLPPTFVAGGTLGAAARAVEHAGDPRRRGTALLYGVNTLGAVAGCLVATFWMLEALGTRSTLWTAAAVNLVLAGVAAALARRTGPLPDTGEAGEARRETPAARPAVAPPGLVLGAAAVVGFAFFLMELVWYRMLGPILGGTVYTFGLVLAVALAGIALGGLLYPVLFARRAVSLSVFAASCLVEAAAVAVPYLLGDRVALLALDLRPAAGSVLAAYLPGWTLVTAIVVLPASIVAGVQFPLLVALLGEGRESVARHLGRAYLWNTGGAIAGALAGGFGLLPLLTAPGCWVAVPLLLAALALVAVAAESRPARARALVGAGTGALALSLLVAEGPTAVWRHSAIGAGRANAPQTRAPNAWRAWANDVRRSIAWEREGVESSVALQAVAGLSFVVNGKVDGNARNDAPTQVMSGMLGALLRPGARRSFVVGLGTGSTAGWLAALPGMERTDVVELEPAILEVARRCVLVNHGAMESQGVRVVAGDAREVLMAGRDRYDLVFSEPSNPYRAGVASLFTREFYEAVASRLEPGGLFLQWVQAYEVDEWTVATVAATLATVFPEVEIWQVNHIDLLLVASERPLVHDAAELRERIREEPFATALRAAWRAETLEDALARFVAGPALARRMRETCGREHRRPQPRRVRVRAHPRAGGPLRRPAAAARRRRLGAGRPAVGGRGRLGDASRGKRARSTRSPAARRRSSLMPRRGSSSHRGTPSVPRRRAGGGRAGPARPDRGAGGGGGDDARRGGPRRGRRPPRGGPHPGPAAGSSTEAEAVTARLALRLDHPDLARDALVSSFVHYRTDPWPGQVSMSHALALADELTLKHPEPCPSSSRRSASPSRWRRSRSPAGWCS